MLNLSQHIRNPIALLVSSAILLAGCGAAAIPAWTYSPAAAGTPGAAAATSAASPAAATQRAVVPTPASSVSVLTGQTVSLSEWKVTMPSSVKAGKATFTISNMGTTAHELLVFKSDLAPEAYPTDPAGGILEEGGGVTLLSDGDNIDPGKTQTRTVELTPGTYLFVCNIPGHFQQGMFTTVTVTQ